ncbi:MAG: methylated-DNA-[protein]-cysteine S-methyltransferase [Francisellaceae bacterium]|jgi:methylated-DNA-[protein]-cysteine S-methyltransferase
MKKLRGVKFLPINAIYDELESPVGLLTIIASTKGLHSVLWENDRNNGECNNIINSLSQSPKNTVIMDTKKQLGEYFHGKRTIFNLPLVLNGTDFQIKAWQQLLEIPYASTISYAQQAEKIGDRKKARAVGMANGLNPISIIIPCHRVIGSNGKLVGFAGGIEMKLMLLNLEKYNL